MKVRTSILAAVGSLVFLTACGGGSGNTTTNGVGPTGGGPGGGTISGSVTKGTVVGATVTAHAVTNGSMGDELGSATTDAAGHFTVELGGYDGPVMLQAVGGSYADEASGTTMDLLAGDVMATVLPTLASGSTSTGVQITPLTTMAASRASSMTGGMTDANIVAANDAVGSYFSVSDIVHVMPMDPTVQGSGTGATRDQKNYGMSLAAMSQYAQTMGMATSSSGMVTLMAKDASDGVMDGMMGTIAISMSGMGGMTGGMMQPSAGTTGLSGAMSTFIGSGMNRSGVTAAEMRSLMDQLAGSSGQLPGAGSTASPYGTMSGTAFMGKVSSGTMTAFAVDGGTMGATIASASVDSSGNFTLPMGAYAGAVMLRMSGATFTDPATGSTMTMQAGDVMTSAVPEMTAGATMTGVQVTPLTSMAQAWAQTMAGGMTAANVAAANGAVGSYFMAGDILMTPPMDPTVSGSGSGATEDQMGYGMSIAAMSAYAKTVGMTVSSSGMVTAMMKDASDGVMNGMMGSTAIAMTGMTGGMGMVDSTMSSHAGTTGLASAMSTFIGSAMNRSGVTAAEMQPLMDALATSNGTIQ